jgi:hypothetical protein
VEAAALVETVKKFMPQGKLLDFDYLPGSLTTKSPWNRGAHEPAGAVRKTKVSLPGAVERFLCR